MAGGKGRNSNPLTQHWCIARQQQDRIRHKIKANIENYKRATIGQKKANPSYSAVAASSCFFVWELGMSLWIRTFPSKTAPSSMAMSGV